MLFGLIYLSVTAQSTSDSNFVRHLTTKQKDSKRDIEYRISHQHTSNVSKVTHTYLQQQHKGIDIFNAVSSIHTTDKNTLLKKHIQWIDSIQYKLPQNLTPKISPQTALKIALQHLTRDEVLQDFEIITLLTQNTAEKLHVLKARSISHDDIKVKLIYAPTSHGIVLTWEVSTTFIIDPQWWNIRINAITGQYVDKNSWTNTCSFNHLHDRQDCQDKGLFRPKYSSMNIPEYGVYPVPLESPLNGMRDTLTNPYNVIASPYGWHDTDGNPGNETTITKGNNVEAKDDIAGDNEVSIGDFAQGTSNMDFRFPLDLTMQPVANKSAMLTNLFYWNNIIHDITYQYGFDEVSGNFQFNNYGNGGLQSDEVLADGLDGGGRGNANFATPPDGSKPRMQMYLWDSPGTSNSFALTSPNTNSYAATRATFGALNYNISNKEILRTTPNNACSTITNNVAIAGKIAMVDRSSSCTFGVQALNAQNAGAIAVIICNNATGANFAMSGGASGASVTIPVVMVSQANCNTIKVLLNTQQVFANLSATVTIQKDGDLDNGIIIHEYGHGISNRLTGGAGNSSCLSNAEQMGEGWSDYFAMMFTMRSTDSGPVGRGIGNYATSQSVNGPGIRSFRYSTDLAVNPQTYNSITSATTPHAVGQVWCAMLWEMTWKLIDLHGFDPDLYNGDGGNNIALKLVMEGLKLQPCSPGFVDGRDAILLADQILFNGAHQCLIWESFAKRGLGFGALQGSNNSVTDGTQSFALNPDCFVKITTIANKITTFEGDSITYQIKVKNVSNSAISNISIFDTIPTLTTFVSATDGGSLNGSRVIFPTTSIPVNDSIIRSFTVRISRTTTGGKYIISDGAEGSISTLWNVFSTTPAQGVWNANTTGPRTGTRSYFAANAAVINDLYLTIKPVRQVRTGSVLSFWHKYNTEVNWDGGRIQVSTDYGKSWQDLGPHITQNPYNGIMDNNPATPGYSGNSGASYIETRVNLNSFSGQDILIRFWMHCDQNTGGVGWNIDDITISEMQTIITNEAVASFPINAVTAIVKKRFLPSIIYNNCQLITNTLDSGEGSLRYAYNCTQVGDTIFVSDQLSGNTIELFSSLVIDKDIALVNTQSLPININTDAVSPTLYIQAGKSIFIENTNISGGAASAPVRVIENYGMLKCKNVSFIDPHLGISGTSILNQGFIEILGQTILKP
jgi:extracellular elastinolytic metalloproteinase